MKKHKEKALTSFDFSQIASEIDLLDVILSHCFMYCLLYPLYLSLALSSLLLILLL